jgi:hypothetical protein
MDDRALAKFFFGPKTATVNKIRKTAHTTIKRSPIEIQYSEPKPNCCANSSSENGKLKSMLCPICELKKMYAPIGNEKIISPKTTETSAEYGIDMP